MRFSGMRVSRIVGSLGIAFATEGEVLMLGLGARSVETLPAVRMHR